MAQPCTFKPCQIITKSSQSLQTLAVAQLKKTAKISKTYYFSTDTPKTALVVHETKIWKEGKLPVMVNIPIHRMFTALFYQLT